MTGIRDENSVNGVTLRDTYDGFEFKLTLPSFDYLIGDILSCNDQPKLVKTDIAQAFWNVRVDPGDTLKLGLKHNDKYYIDASLVFGTVNGTAILQRISDTIQHILASEQIYVCNYIDDIFASLPTRKVEQGFNRIVDLIRELGLPINPDKLVSPGHEMTCMGILINAKNKSISLPQEKMQEILRECQDHIPKKYIKKDICNPYWGNFYM